METIFFPDVKISDEDFYISEPYFTAVTCFLTFNVFSVVGNILPSACRKVKRRSSVDDVTHIFFDFTGQSHVYLLRPINNIT